jgi:hypothetical protein
MTLSASVVSMMLVVVDQSPHHIMLGILLSAVLESSLLPAHEVVCFQGMDRVKSQIPHSKMCQSLPVSVRQSRTGRLGSVRYPCYGK